MDYEIKDTTWKDLKPVYELEKVCFHEDAWPLIEYIGALTFSDVIRLKVVAAGEIIGFGMADLRPSQHKAIIATIAIAPEYRNQGIGEALMLRLEERANLPLIQLTVKASNYPAINLYQKMGYQRVEIAHNYYRGREDGLIMEKHVRTDDQKGIDYSND